MKCSSCGNEINDAAKFCPYCGAAVSKTTDTGSVYENAFRSNSTNTDFNDITDKTVSAAPENNGYPVRSDQEPAQKSGLGLGIAGMVLGILTIIFCWIIFIAPITGIVGIVLSAISRKQEKNGFAAAGLATSIIGLVLAIILICCFGAAFLFVNRVIYY